MELGPKQTRSGPALPGKWMNFALNIRAAGKFAVIRVGRTRQDLFNTLKYIDEYPILQRLPRIQPSLF
jgi:hypothetical protein